VHDVRGVRRVVVRVVRVVVGLDHLQPALQARRRALQKLAHLPALEDLHRQVHHRAASTIRIDIFFTPKSKHVAPVVCQPFQLENIEIPGFFGLKNGAQCGRNRLHQI